MARDLCGGSIAQTLPIEQPLIFNLQVDILIRNVLREIHHVECQSTNEAGFAFRMLRYYVYLRDLYPEPIRIVNLHDYKAGQPGMEQQSVGAHGDKPMVLHEMWNG